MQIDRRHLLTGALGACVLPLRRAHGQAAASGIVPALPIEGLAPASPRVTVISKPIPSSNELLPVIGLGTARRYQDPHTDELGTLRETLLRFVQAGGSVIDTAPSYGNAESVVGALVDSAGLRDSLFLATKVGASGREAGLEQIEDSFRRLRAQRIDLIAVHNLRDVETQLASLRELQRAGRIRYVGITTSSDRQYADFERTMKQQKLDFIQVDYALDNRGAAERILPLAHERGVAVMINLPFGRGTLFRAVRGKALPAWAAEIDCRSWAQFFLKYIVSHAAVVCAIPGTAKPEYAIDNAGAARGRLADAAMRRRMERFVDAL